MLMIVAGVALALNRCAEVIAGQRIEERADARMRYRYAQGDDGGEEGCGSWVWNQLDAIYAWRSTQKRARTSRSTPALTPMHSRAPRTAISSPSLSPFPLQSQGKSLPSAPCQPRCGTRLEQQSRGDWSEAVGRHIRYQQSDFAS
ncbi:hypothetical protein L1887_48775 [Cichorium endivia]|nr:hypothetical protein L1887_48775 [Cichorium endivia]